MELAIIVQARMSSIRLPGKVLMEAAGRPVLGHVLDRLKKVGGASRLIVATSVCQEDDPIARYCAGRSADCYRGPLENVAARFMEIVQRYRLGGFVRISADSPWIDPAVVGQALELFMKAEYPIVTNILKRSFPKGQSVEVLDAELFGRAFASMREPAEQEHLTSYFYAHKNEYPVFNFESGGDFSAVNLCVDTPQDFERFALVASKAGKSSGDLGWRQVVELYRQAA